MGRLSLTETATPREQAPPPTPPLKGRGEIASPARNTPIVTPAPVPGSTPPQAQPSSLKPHARLPVAPGTRPG